VIIVACVFIKLIIDLNLMARTVNTMMEPIMEKSVLILIYVPFFWIIAIRSN